MAKRDPFVAFIVLFVGCPQIDARAVVWRGRLSRDVRFGSSAVARWRRSPRVRAHRRAGYCSFIIQGRDAEYV